MARSRILEGYASRKKGLPGNGRVPAVPASPGSRLKHWGSRVLKQRKKAVRELTADNVHHLRTALRRCLSIEEAISRFDPDPRWGKMRRAAKKMLKSLGELRDSDVLLEWLKKLPIAHGETGEALRKFIETEHEGFRRKARAAIRSFDQHKWNEWVAELAPHADSIAPDSPELRYVALEGWQKAYDRHRFAMRSRSKRSYHRTRIALKRLRYTVENFLPSIAEKWDDEPKQMQDLLGEVHDLDVLWSKLLTMRHRVGKDEQRTWKSALNNERRKRLKKYLSRTSGKNSLWSSWRKSLPDGDDLERAVLAELGAWARFRTPEFTRQQRVAAVAVELFDTLAARGLTAGLALERARNVIHAAALVEDAGRIRGEKGHHKETYRMVRRLALPIGWKPSDLQLMGLVARYHRKALPLSSDKEFRGLSAALRRTVLLLAGILRLANAFEPAPAAIRKIQVDVTTEGLLLRAYGFEGEEPLLSRLATAKHLLEIACRRPIFITPGAAGAPLRKSERKTASQPDAA